jgi:hypothetical protein
MRYGLTLILTSVLLLSACNGAPAPTATVEPTDVPATATPEAETQATQAPVITIPPVGEISRSPTEDPEAGLVFDSIIFTQTGGSTEGELVIEIHSDGTMIRDGETGTISQEDVTRIDDMLDDINFFGIEGIFEAAAANPDAYSYTITVERAGASRMIPAQDTYAPQELKDLFAAILALGQPQQQAPSGG